jgi:hypothetical protein
MKLTNDDVKQMKADNTCPCCTKRLSNLEVEHLAAKATKPTEESYRPQYPAAVEQRIRESRERYGLSGVPISEPDRERASNRMAAAMGVRSEEGRRVFLQGRCGFDPTFCATEAGRV